jgi:copper chaperone CopZ
MRANLPQPDADDAGGVEPELRQAAGGAPSTGQPGARAGREGREVRDSALRDSLLVTQVDGMHSHTCEERIIRAVGGLPGVREVEVDFASGQASVIFDARKVSTHQLIEAIEAAGYRCADPAMGHGGGALE